MNKINYTELCSKYKETFCGGCDVNQYCRDKIILSVDFYFNENEKIANYIEHKHYTWIFEHKLNTFDEILIEILEKINHSVIEFSKIKKDIKRHKFFLLFGKYVTENVNKIFLKKQNKFPPAFFKKHFRNKILSNEQTTNGFVEVNKIKVPIYVQECEEFELKCG
ncbi:MAG: hypothetical protein B6I23_01970 [Rickettsiaceae bacterium 4572_127]|nr:MAG: hypothetical protein B6I23_01970 [Rickettsiaceae bacterium 4572_127]